VQSAESRRCYKSVTNLNHEFGDDAVEGGVIIVAVLGVRHEILHGLRALLREQCEGQVAHGGVHDDSLPSTSI
jgi:hypothetical protein